MIGVVYMKIGVLGAGLMGKEAARDLVLSEQVEVVGLADVEIVRAQQVCDYLQSPKLTAHHVDANDKGQLRTFMKDFDVVINALFYSFNKVVAEIAIELGVHAVDLGGHIGNVTKEVLQLNERARTSAVTIIPDLGVAPGMINILSGYSNSKLDQLTSLQLYVGGIPLHPENPLAYNHVFSMEGVFDHYTDPSVVVRDGVVREVPSLSEVETIFFKRFGPLEAFHTSGGTSTLIESYPEIENLQYKTIRYPGHAEKFKLLVDLGLTKRDNFVDVGGQKVSPREVFLQMLNPIVALGDKEDVVLLRVIARGEKGGEVRTIEHEMIVHKDSERNITAMARVTASTVSIVAQMLASGTITKRGVHPPESIVPGDLFIEQLAERDIIIDKKINNHVKEKDRIKHYHSKL